MDTAYQRSLKQHIQCLNVSFIPDTTRGCPMTATLWWRYPALVSSVHCPPYDPLLRLTWSLAGDWLTTRQDHPHSSSHWDLNILEATKERFWEKNFTCRFQVPDFETHPQAAKKQPGPAFHHTSELQHSITSSPQHAGTLWDITCVLPQPGKHNWVTGTKVLFPWKVSQLNNIVVKLSLESHEGFPPG